MEIRLQLILTMCFVNSGLTTVAAVGLHSQTADQATSSNVNDEYKIRENFENLFDSIAKNDISSGRTYRDILKNEVAKERHAFDFMKEQLRHVRRRNPNYKKSFYKRSGGEVVAKREAEASRNDSDVGDDIYVFPEIRSEDAFNPTLKLLMSQKKRYEQMKEMYEKLRGMVGGAGEYRMRISEGSLRDLNGTLLWLGNIIDLDIEVVRNFLFGDKTPDEDDKKIPWRHASSSVVLFHWQSIKRYGSEMKGDETLMKQLDKMYTLAAKAIKEIEIYKKYVETVLPVFTAAPTYEVFVTNYTISGKMR